MWHLVRWVSARISVLRLSFSTCIRFICDLMAFCVHKHMPSLAKLLLRSHVRLSALRGPAIHKLWEKWLD